MTTQELAQFLRDAVTEVSDLKTRTVTDEVFLIRRPERGSAEFQVSVIKTRNEARIDGGKP